MTKLAKNYSSFRFFLKNEIIQQNYKKQVGIRDPRKLWSGQWGRKLKTWVQNNSGGLYTLKEM